MQTLPRVIRGGVFVAAILSSVIAVPAQVPPSTASGAANQDETVTLSPFAVNTTRDAGWVASSTLMGNRSNEQLLNLPMSVDALTGEFLRDMGVYNIEDASAMIANTVVAPNLDVKGDEGRVTFRGFTLDARDNVQAQSGRNFFPTFTPQDTYNVERIDFAKGSNSLMFGSQQPGGEATTYTKRAGFSNFNSATAIFDSFGSYRYMLDVNRKVTDRFAVRVNLVDRSDRTYIDFTKTNLRAGDVTMTEQLFPSTQIRLEAEGGTFYRKRGVNGARVQLQSAPGLGYSNTNRWTFSPEDGVVYTPPKNGAVLPGVITPTDPADLVGTAGSLISVVEGRSAPVSMRSFVNGATVFNGQTLTVHGFNKKINLDGSNDYLLRPYSGVTAWLEQSIGDLNLELSYNQQNQNQQRWDGGIPDEIDLKVTGTGRLYEEGQYQFKKFGNKDRNFRLLASYPIKLGWMSQFLVASLDRQRDAAYSFRYTVGNAAAPGGVLTNNDIFFRVYLDDPAYRTDAFWQKYEVRNLPRSATFQPVLHEFTSASRPFWDYRYTNAYALSASGSYWDGLFRTLVGIRYDEFRRKITNIPAPDAFGNVNNPGSPEDNPGAYSYDAKSDLSHPSRMAGLMFRPPFAKNVNIFATYSESFTWQGRTDFTGNPLTASLGKNREAGVKSSLFDNKLIFTASVYRIDKDQDAFSFGGNLNALQLETLFNPIGLPTTDPKYLHIATGFNSESTTEPQVSRSEGYELTLQTQRYHGIQTRFTFGHNNKTSKKDMSLFRALYDQAAARIAALAPDDPNVAILTPLLSSAASILKNNEGIQVITGRTSIPNTLSFSVDYELPRDWWLKGTRVGVTGTWNDAYNIGNNGLILFRGDAGLPINAYVIHERKIFEHPTYFRLGLRNIVDLENGKLRRTGVNFVDANGLPNYDYRYTNMFSVDLDMSVKF